MYLYTVGYKDKAGAKREVAATGFEDACKIAVALPLTADVKVFREFVANG